MKEIEGKFRWHLYNALFPLAYIALAAKCLKTIVKRGGYGAHFWQRLGIYDKATRAKLQERRRVWIHAVSVGEAGVAGLVMGALRKLDPGISFILSTTSSTGYATCEKIVQPDDVLVYFPIDSIRCVRRALDAARPRAMILTESEFWPMAIIECARREIPLHLVNGRISDRSYPSYRRFRWLFGPALKLFDKMLVQYKTDEERLIDMGARPESIEVVGSVKFDVPPPSEELVRRMRGACEAARIQPGRNVVLLGASTWPGEERTMLEAYRQLLPGNPGLKLVIAPRHKERGAEVEEEIKAAGFDCLRRSIDPDGERLSQAMDNAVLLADTTGELFGLMANADIVFVGKSLPPNSGGQNMIEPLSLGKPVIVGPRTENFAGPMKILRREKCIIEISGAKELKGAVGNLLEHEEARRRICGKARATVADCAGSLSKTAEMIVSGWSG